MLILFELVMLVFHSLVSLLIAMKVCSSLKWCHTRSFVEIAVVVVILGTRGLITATLAVAREVILLS